MLREGRVMRLVHDGGSSQIVSALYMHMRLAGLAT